MREHHYRQPPAKIHNGVPDAPKYMMLGTSFITVENARIVSVLPPAKHDKGQGRLVVHIVAGEDEALLHPRGAAKDAEPERLPYGVQLAFVAHSAQEIAAALGGGNGLVDTTRFVPAPDMKDGETPLYIDECPAFQIVRMTADDSAFVFLRSWDKPYAIRIQLSKDDRDLLASSLIDLIMNLRPEDWDAYVTPLDVPCVVGPQPEQRSPAAEPLPAPPPRAKEPPAPVYAPPPWNEEKPKGFLGRLLARVLGLAASSLGGLESQIDVTKE